MNAKYIIGYIPGKIIGAGAIGPIIIPAWCDHAETARKLNITDIKSAGFVKICSDATIDCYGRANSLNIDSGKYDDISLSRMLFGN